MTIYENLGTLCAVSAVVVVGIILYFFIPTANYAGAYRLAKAYFARFWAFILYAHGSVMKDIIFLLSLFFTLIGFWESLEPNCKFNIHIAEFGCLKTTPRMIYDPFSHYSEIACTSCLKWCIFLLLTLFVYLWDCLNAIISLQAWSRDRFLPTKPWYFYFLVVCCALFQCTFIWFVFPWKLRWILQFAQLEADLPILQQSLGGCEPDCFAQIIYGKFKLSCFILITFICCIYRTYVIASYIYRIAGEVQYLFATRILNKPEYRSQGIQERNPSRELSETDDSQAKTTISMLERSQSEWLKAFAEVKNLLAGDRDRFDEKLAGIERQLGDNREKSKEELADVKTLIKHNRDESKEEPADVKTLIKHNRDKSKEELADIKSLIEGNQKESGNELTRFKEELVGIMRQFGENQNKSKEELESVIKGNRKKSKKELAGIMKQLEGKSEKDLAAVKKLFEDSLAKSEKVQTDAMNQLRQNLAEHNGELVGIRSLSMHNLEALSGNNTLLAKTRDSLDSNNDLLRRNFANYVDGRPLKQSRSPYDTSNAVRKSSTRPTSNWSLSTPSRPPINKGRGLLQHNNLSNFEGHGSMQPKTKTDNATNNAVGDSTQSKDNNPNPTVNSSSDPSLPTMPAATGPPLKRNRVSASRLSPTNASNILSPAPTTEHESPRRTDHSTFLPPEINKRSDTSTATHSEPPNAPEIPSDTVPDPTHPSLLQRDQKGSESNGSGPATEPTDQRSQPRSDPETKNVGPANSGYETSRQETSNLHRATGLDSSQMNLEPTSGGLTSPLRPARSKPDLGIPIPEENSGNPQSANPGNKRVLPPSTLPLNVSYSAVASPSSRSVTNSYTSPLNNATTSNLAHDAAKVAHSGSPPSSPPTRAPRALIRKASNSSLAADAARAASNGSQYRQSSQSPTQSPTKEYHPPTAPVRPQYSRTSTTLRNPIPRSRSNSNKLDSPQILDPLGTLPNLNYQKNTSVEASSDSHVKSDGAKSKSKSKLGKAKEKAEETGQKVWDGISKPFKRRK